MTMGAESVDTAVEEISDLEKKIIRQVEYYFGDYNLPMDKFMKELVKENDGWISMDVMLKFKRLQVLSDDSAVITSALKKSPTKLIEVSEDGTKIRRNVDKPLPENPEDLRLEIDSRTLYIKGFGLQTTLDELLDFFKPHRNPENIFMRRKKDKKFKGSVYVTFITKEDADVFYDLKGTKFNGTELIKERKADYLKRKDEWYQNLQKEKEAKKLKKTEKSKKDGSEAHAESEHVKGCILKLSGLKADVMWEDIKEVLSPHGSIAYVDYSKGKPVAYVRFEAAVASDVLNAAATEDKIIRVKDSEAVAVVLEDEEEVKYWQNIAQSKKDRSKRNFSKGGKRFGKGRFNQKGKRKHDGGHGGPPSKASKTEAE